MFLSSCLVFKGLKVEKSKEINLVENKKKAHFYAYSKYIEGCENKSKVKVDTYTPGSVTLIFTVEVKQN